MDDYGLDPVASSSTATLASVLMSGLDRPLTGRPQRQDTTQRHPDAPSSDEESFCLMRLFNYVKEQLSDFFSWLCRCFSSDDNDTNKSREGKKGVEEEDNNTKQEEFDAQTFVSGEQDSSTSSLGQSSPISVAEFDKGVFMRAVRSGMNDPIVYASSPQEVRDVIDLGLIATSMESLLQPRYGKPINDDNEAMIVLCDLQKLYKLQCSVVKDKPHPALLFQDKEKVKKLKEVAQLGHAQMKGPMPTTISDREKQEVQKMIQELDEPMEILEGLPESTQKSLLAYIDKSRKRVLRQKDA